MSQHVICHDHRGFPTYGVEGCLLFLAIRESLLREIPL